MWNNVAVYWKYILKVIVSTGFCLLEVEIVSGGASLTWTEFLWRDVTLKNTRDSMQIWEECVYTSTATLRGITTFRFMISI